MAFSCSPLNSLLKNVQHFYQRLQFSRDRMQTVKTIQNHKQHFNEYCHIQVIMGPDGFCQTWHILVDPKRYRNTSEPSRPYPD